MTASFDILVEIPTVSMLIGSSAVPELTSDRVAVSAQKLAYQPGGADPWNLPAERSDVAGTLEMAGSTPCIRCALPLPEPGDVALYRVVVLKTGAVLDAEGETRAEQLLPTEEELMLFVVGGADGRKDVPHAYERLIPGVQHVIVPAATP